MIRKLNSRKILQSIRLFSDKSSETTLDRGALTRGAVQNFLKKSKPSSLTEKILDNRKSLIQRSGRYGPPKTNRNENEVENAGTKEKPKIFNNRFPGSNNRPATGYQNRRQSGRKGRRSRIPGIMTALIKVDKIMVDKARAGTSVLNTSRMDEMDQFFANVFHNAAKTESGEFHQVFKLKAFNRTEIPTPRKIEYLLSEVMTPPITVSKVGSPGYEIAAEAWEVIQKNYFFTDEQKVRLVNGIASLRDKIDAFEKAYETSDDRDDDLLFEEGFRKGEGYMNEQERARRLLNGENVDEEEDYIQEETDWDTEAVEDEDELYN